MSPKVHPRALGRILSQIRFGSTLNIAASLASPCRPTHALRGVYNEDMVSKAAEVMKEIGYERAMVVHGFDEAGNHGMDELSIIGESAVLEFDSGRDNRYKMTPEDIGAKRATYEEIQAMGDVNRESIRFLSVLAGRGYDSCREFTCLNAGAIFYVAGRATDMKSGLEMARETIGNGRAFEKMAQWVVAQADENGYGKTRFNAVAKAAGLEKEASALM